MWINLDTPSALGLRQLATATANKVAVPATATSKVWTTPMIRALVWTWLSLNIVGQVLLLLLLATFFFGRRLKSKRHPTVLNFVFTHLLSTIPACLLLYGNVHLDNQPDPWLCLYNASAMAGVAPMVSVSFFAVVLQVYSLMRCVAAKKEYVQRTWVTVLLIAMPYVAFIGFGLATGVVGFLDPKNVTREEIVYCSVREHSLGLYIWTPTICVVVATLGVGMALVILLWRNWRDLRGNSVVDFHLVVRALCFAVFEIFLVVTLVLTIFDNNVVPKFMSAVAPIGVFLIFSTQPDVIHSWFPCLAKRRDMEGMVRTSSVPPSAPQFTMIDPEKFAPEYSFQTTESSKPSALRGVPGLRVSTIGMPQPIPASDFAASPASGMRTLTLASSAASSPRFAGRPSHSPSLSEVSNSITLRPEGRPRAPGLQHGRHNSSFSVSGVSSYSDASWRSNGSGAPLVVRTVDGMRRPSDQAQGSSYRSDTGVLGNVPYEHSRA